MAPRQDQLAAKRTLGRAVLGVLQEEGDGELLDPTLAQEIAPRLMDEVERLHAELARARRKHLTSVDKQNILETSRLWRRIVERVASDYPDVKLDHLLVEDSGSLNAKSRNNTTGGVLLEEGTDDFTVADSTFRNIRGNAVWTHSRYRSPRNSRGKIANVKVSEIGRDAIQVGHATGVVVEGNQGSRIGFPAEIVDVENGGTPVGIECRVCLEPIRAGDQGVLVYSTNQRTGAKELTPIHRDHIDQFLNAEG